MLEKVTHGEFCVVAIKIAETLSLYCTFEIQHLVIYLEIFILLQIAKRDFKHFNMSIFMGIP